MNDTKRFVSAFIPKVISVFSFYVKKIVSVGNSFTIKMKHIKFLDIMFSDQIDVN